MYLGQTPDSILTTADEQIRKRQASLESIAPNPKLARFLNIFVLAPSMLTVALSKNPSKWVKISLLIGGISTLLGNIERSISNEQKKA